MKWSLVLAIVASPCCLLVYVVRVLDGLRVNGSRLNTPLKATESVPPATSSPKRPASVRASPVFCARQPYPFFFRLSVCLFKGFIAVILMGYFNGCMVMGEE